MKSVTEFPQFQLGKALQTKTTLLTAGKTPEEIQQSLGEAFKMEGDKLNHFMQAIDVAEKNPEKLKRVLVMSLAEGETAPAKSVQVESTVYLPEFLVDATRTTAAPDKNKRGKGKGGDSKKGSPWGLTPEEKAAKGGGKGKG
jgi:hypothetical protein